MESNAYFVYFKVLSGGTPVDNNGVKIRGSKISSLIPSRLSAKHCKQRILNKHLSYERMTGRIKLDKPESLLPLTSCVILVKLLSHPETRFLFLDIKFKNYAYVTGLFCG